MKHARMHPSRPREPRDDQGSRTHGDRTTSRLRAFCHGLRLTPKHRRAIELVRRSRETVEHAKQIVRWTHEPELAAALVRKAAYRLVAAVVVLDGGPPSNARQARQWLGSSPTTMTLFAGLGEELAWLDEMNATAGPATDPLAVRARLQQLVTKLPALSAAVEAHLSAQQRADGLRPRARRVLAGAALLGAATVAAVVPSLVVGAGGGGSGPKAPPLRVLEGADVPPDVLADSARCFEATYFAAQDFQRPVATRRDCVVEFDWGLGAVADLARMPTDSFSVRWRGVLQVPDSADYTFFLMSDDGSRLYLDDRLVVDNWGNHGLREQSSRPIPMRAGEEHRLRIDYFDAEYSAAVQLSWQASTFDRRPLTGRHVRRPDS